MPIAYKPKSPEPPEDPKKPAGIAYKPPTNPYQVTNWGGGKGTISLNQAGSWLTQGIKSGWQQMTQDIGKKWQQGVLANRAQAYDFGKPVLRGTYGQLPGFVPSGAPEGRLASEARRVPGAVETKTAPEGWRHPLAKDRWTGNYLDYNQPANLQMLMGYGSPGAIFLPQTNGEVPPWMQGQPDGGGGAGGYPGYYGWGGGGGGGGWGFSRAKKSWYSDLVNWRI